MMRRLLWMLVVLGVVVQPAAAQPPARVLPRGCARVGAGGDGGEPALIDMAIWPWP